MRSVSSAATVKLRWSIGRLRLKAIISTVPTAMTTTLHHDVISANRYSEQVNIGNDVQGGPQNIDTFLYTL